MNKQQFYTWSCGCKFPVKREFKDNLPLIDFRYENIKDCPAVWELFDKGLTLGIFQLDSPTGIKWCKEIKPTEIRHLEAMNAALRPGCLGNTDENKISVTQHYANRKNGKEEIPIKYPAIAHLLHDTYQLILYQETQMFIAMEACAFSSSDADSKIRKGVGKKDAKLLLSIEDEFLNGAKKVGKITEQDAKDIFSSIKASARYAFNKSHANLYGLKGYKEAYLKVHFPVQFYTSKLKSPRKSKSHEEIADLIYEARLFDIEAKLPDLRHYRESFHFKGNSIWFGLVDIKHYGQAAFRELKEALASGIDFTSSFYNFVMNSTRYLGAKDTNLLVEAGAVDFFGLPREEMLAECELLQSLTSTQKDKLWKYLDAEKAGIFNDPNT